RAASLQDSQAISATSNHNFTSLLPFLFQDFIMCKSKLMPSTEVMKHLQIPLLDILSATNGFSKENLIGRGGYGPVYQGMSEKHGHIAVKRLRKGQKEEEADIQFKTEI
ncbi:hypothetical protein M8C21_031231, partial [Ambrosia artemisiifolia]